MFGIVDLKAFKVATAHPVFTKLRGANIEKIDHLLARWESQQVRADAQAQVAVLAAILQECKLWLRLKLKKKPVPGNADTSMYARRYRAIKQLAEDALKTLLEMDPEMYRAYSTFQVRKNVHRANLGVTPTRAMVTQPLAGGYINERKAYVQSLKTYATSASRMNVHLNASHGPGFLGGTQRKKWLGVVHGKTFDQLSETDFITLGRMMKQEGATAQVAYYSKLDRLHDMLRVGINHDGDSILVDYHDHPAHGALMYAIDEYGNVFARDASNQVAFNHSSFNAGKNVVCAGTLRCDHGHLVEIDNTSGHYRPGRNNLKNAVVVLLDVLELDLARCVVSCYVPAGEKFDAGGGQYLRPFDLLTWNAGHARNFANGFNPDTTQHTFLV